MTVQNDRIGNDDDDKDHLQVSQPDPVGTDKVEGDGLANSSARDGGEHTNDILFPNATVVAKW